MFCSLACSWADPLGACLFLAWFSRDIEFIDDGRRPKCLAILHYICNFPYNQSSEQYKEET